ncbi:MAG: transporter substrate-binding domain-containing protein [Methylomarinum sp.]|nr:transporter substrate-binding domain-containing protein [Methylomarinum sp.]
MSVPLFFIVLFFSYSALAEEIVLEANESPPFWSQELPNQGMGGDIVQAISSVSGLKTTIRFLPLKRLIERTDNNDLGNPLFYMPNQDFAAIIPIASYHVSFFYYQPLQKEVIGDDLLQNLQHYKIGVLEGTFAEHRYFSERNISFETSYSQASLFKKLKHGRVDLVLAVDLVAIRTINQLFPEQAHEFKQINLPNSGEPIAIMISENQKEAENVAAKYRQGLKEIIKSGQYLQVLKKYYGVFFPVNWLSDLDKFEQLYSYE